MKTLIFTFAGLVISVALGSDPELGVNLTDLDDIAMVRKAHLGFDLEQTDERMVVRNVHQWSPAHADGVREGDVLVAIVGAKARTIDEINDLVAKKKPGDPVRIRFKTEGKKESLSRTVHLDDAENFRARIAKDEKREADQREMAKQAQEWTEKAAQELQVTQAAERERQQQDLKARIAKHGEVQILVGVVARDPINQPIILLTVKNHSRHNMDAIEFRVQLFDKFDRPVEGIFGASNEKTFLCQRIIDAGGQTEVLLGAPWHDTVGKAKVSVVQYVIENGSPVKVPNPEVIVVKQH